MRATHASRSRPQRPGAVVGGLASLLVLQFAGAPAVSAQESERPGTVRSCVCVPGDTIWTQRLPTEEWTRDLRRGLESMRIALARARLGILLGDVTGEAANRGIQVRGVTAGGPAELAGIREGDVLLALQGRALGGLTVDDEPEDRPTSPEQRLRAIMAEVEPGDTVAVEYLRDDRRMTARVVVEAARPTILGTFPDSLRLRLEELPRRIEVRRAAEALRTLPGMARIGVRMANLNPGLGHYFGVERGALVLEVHDPNPLSLEAGDVLVRIDSREVADADHARRILASYRAGETVSGDVLRRGERVTVAGRID